MPELRNQPWPKDIQPTVSVYCATYNQASYIQQAIEGFLSQNTTFPVEVLIHDDASTDGTAEIVSDYASRFPNVIRATLQKENQLSLGRSPHQILKQDLRGDYIAYCEGDDYWTVSEKLQIQVEHLEQNPDASACFHPADGIFEGAEPSRKERHFAPEIEKPRYFTEDLLLGDNFIPTASMLLRGDVQRSLGSMRFRVPHADHFTWVYASLKGPILYLPNCMSAYRKHAGGIHSGIPFASQALNSAKTIFAMANLLNMEDKHALSEGFKRRSDQVSYAISEYEHQIKALRDEVKLRDETIDAFRNSRGLRILSLINRIRRLLSRRK